MYIHSPCFVKHLLLTSVSFQFQDNSQNKQTDELISTTIEELLINCVMARPPLWDCRLPLKESSKTIREQLWKEIFDQFGQN